MKTLTTRFFLCILLIIFIIPTICAENGQAAVSDLNMAKLHVKPISVEANGQRHDLDANGAFAKFKIDVSSEINLADLKTVQVKSENGAILFYAIAEYKIPVNYWTYYSASDCISGTYTRNIRWMRINRYKITSVTGAASSYRWESPIDSTVSWQYYSVYQGPLAQFRSPTFELKFSKLPEVLVESAKDKNYTLQSSIDRINFMSVSTTKSESTEIGNYKSQYGGNWQGGTLNLHDGNAIQNQDRYTVSTGAMSSTIKNELQAKMLAESTGVRAETPYWRTRQQGQRTGNTVGAAIGITKINNETVRITPQLYLQPDVQELVQSIKVRGAEIDHRLYYWPWNEAITSQKFFGETTYTDIRGVKIQNYVVQETYSVKIELVSKLQLSGNLKPEAILSLPSHEVADAYWDLAINGDTAQFIGLLQKYGLGDLLHDSKTTSDAALSVLEDWLPYIIGAIALIAVVYVIIQFQPMISAAVKAKSRTM